MASPGVPLLTGVPSPSAPAVPPSILGEELNMSVVVNESVALECRSHAVPPPVLRWQKDGGALEPRPGIRLSADKALLEVCRCAARCPEKLKEQGRVDLWVSQVPVSIVRLTVTNDHRPGDRAIRVSLRTPAYAGCPNLPCPSPSCDITIPVSKHHPFISSSFPSFSKATVQPHEPQVRV